VPCDYFCQHIHASRKLPDIAAFYASSVTTTLSGRIACRATAICGTRRQVMTD
jgi:hypothetical protein